MIRFLIRCILIFLPDSVREKIKIWYNRNAVAYFKDRGRYRELFMQIFFHKYTSKKAYEKKWQRLQKVRQKEKITVVFQVWNVSKWRCDSVYRLMHEHPRFEPYVWMVDEPGFSSDVCKENRKKLLRFFEDDIYKKSLANNWAAMNKELNPDLVFIQDHYLQDINMHPCAYNHLLCYVRYCYMTTNLTKGIDYFLSHALLFFFQEHQSIADMSRRVLTGPAEKFVVTGHPIADYLVSLPFGSSSVWRPMPTPCKKLIWAPHWTVQDNTELAYRGVSTFMRLCGFMIELAKKYSGRLQIAFKPHPSLYVALCNHPDWGKEKTNAYYNCWQSMPNTQLETGSYRELFQQSDAMIHDCGSFIIEYMLVNKPCMYLGLSSGFDNFNELNEKALSCHEKGTTESDIESFVRRLLSGEVDTKREQRIAFLNAYLLPPHGKSASQNIVDAILGA